MEPDHNSIDLLLNDLITPKIGKKRRDLTGNTMRMDISPVCKDEPVLQASLNLRDAESRRAARALIRASLDQITDSIPDERRGPGVPRSYDQFSTSAWGEPRLVLPKGSNVTYGDNYLFYLKDDVLRAIPVFHGAGFKATTSMIWI